MLPVFKEVVERLFAEGLIKVVFATETLALGINMPARSVVLESLVKWNGEAHVDLTPGEYTQLTGRAGRRGIDVEGHGVVLWTPGFDPRHVAGLASTRTYPLRSSFRPSYNMAVNLVAGMGRAAARELLESSFAQFQADRGAVGLTRQLKRNDEALSGYSEAMECHLGDFGEYAGLRRALKERESTIAREGAVQRKAAAAESLERLRPGDVIQVPAGRRAGLAVVIDPLGGAPVGDPHPVVLTGDRQVKKLSVVDFPSPVEAISRVRLPRNFNARSPQARRDLASSLRNLGLEETSRPRRPRSAAADDAEIARLRAAIRAHPCHGCAEREDHARWAERYDRLTRDTKQLARRVDANTHTIARMFDRVCDVLESLRYLDGDNVVVPAQEFPSNFYPWLQLRRHGVEIREVAMAEGRARIDDLVAALDEGTRVLAISAVQYSSGHRYDLAALAATCRQRDVLLVVDGTQAVGAVTVDVEREGIDVLAVSAHKWLLGPFGIGFTHLSQRAMQRLNPSTVGWLSVEDPFAFDHEPQLAADGRRFESGTENSAGIAGLGATVDLVLELGPQRVEARVLDRAEQLAALLDEAGLDVQLSPRRSGIVIAGSPGIAPAGLHEHLLAQGIRCSLRGSGLRFSPHYFSDDADLHRAASGVRDLARAS